MKNATAVPTVKEKEASVDSVVQEYMDTLLGDLFPPVDDIVSEVVELPRAVITEVPVVAVASKDVEEAVELVSDPIIETVEPVIAAESNLTAEPIVKSVVEPAVKLTLETNAHEPDLKADTLSEPYQFTPPQPRSPEFVAPEIPQDDTEAALEAPEMEVKPVNDVRSPDVKLNEPKIKIAKQVTKKTAVLKTPLPVVDVPAVNDIPDVAPEIHIETAASEEPEVEKKYPKAPTWAQESFDVLLFDVCGLKLAVPMDSLGKIIKVEHETNQLIGRPDWFIGAYNESEEHLYVVDTAKYIMPEKGYDLEKEGFAYLIQLQRSKWTLACKQVHTTVRLEPDQVKWRSSGGKRQWLSGTVIEHMCALIHVDNLVDILNADS